MRRVATRTLLGVAGILAGVAVVFLAANLLLEKPPKMLTTTVDMKKRVINDNSVRGIFTVEADFLGTYDVILELSAAAVDSLTDPSVTYIRVEPGMRKEEIANILQDKLGWSVKEKEIFIQTELPRQIVSEEGFFYPGVYVLPKDSKGKTVGKLMTDRFREEVLSRYATSTEKMVSLDTALKIASIIEREANGKEDMRLVSGVIWNRLFKEMSLDMDATLQYVKGTEKNGWWPRVLPKDKFIDSPFNTYLYEGLPPTPISNARLTTIAAALNPRKTPFIFYLHDKLGRFHGAITYEEHLNNIDKYLR